MEVVMTVQSIRKLARNALPVLIVAALFVASAGLPALAAPPIKIGVVLSVTGWGAIIGSNQKDALVAIVEDVNKKGGVLGRQVELYIEDDKSNPTNAVLATTKLVRDTKVSVIMGPSIADSGMAMIPIIEQEKIAFAVSGPVVSPYKKWLFHVTPNDLIGAARMMEAGVNVLGGKRIAILHDTANFGMTGMKVFNSEIKEYPGASIVIEEKFEPADTNMIPQLTKIKAVKPDIILLQCTSGPASVVAKNYKQLGMKIPVLAVHAIALPDFFKNAGPIAEENEWVFFCAKAAASELLPVNDPYRKNIYEPFKKLIQEKYGPTKQVSVFHAVAYDAIHIVLEAIKTAGSDDRAAIRNAMEKIQIDGTMGTYQGKPDDHRGYFKDVAPLVLWKGGQFVLYKK
jgi:branched-chain amino acid transport system substrate-binding protein